MRLEKFESQEKLADMIKASGNGLSECRKLMLKVDIGAPTAREDVEAILLRSEQYVLAFKKHTKTAQTLIASNKEPKKKKQKTGDNDDMQKEA